MKLQDRQIFWLQGERRRIKLEAQFKPKILANLNAQLQEYVQAIREAKISTSNEATALLSTMQPITELGQTIKALYLRSGLNEANFIYKQVRTLNLKFTFGFNQKWTDEILNYFKTFLLNKAVLPITETTKKLVLKLLSTGLADGLTFEEAVQAILQKATDLNRSRTNVIVRTESVRAMNVGAMLGANESRLVMDKIWITAKDERVRSSHRQLDGDKANMDDVFNNGCSFPGDPNGKASETINCRCRLGFEPKRDENGRLIRRESEPLRLNQTGALTRGINAGF